MNDADMRFEGLTTLAARLDSGKTTSRDLVEWAAQQLQECGEDGQRSFVEHDLTAARELADTIDKRRARGDSLPPFAGIPVTVKDLFDVAGQTTRAGSLLRDGEPAAPADAEAVSRLRDAGFIVIGRTNMTEFAYSGLGLNPHFGTPRNAWDRDNERIPGGSSSGAATTVAWGISAAGLGTDTGGSCRIPAAFNGIVGFKPTAARVSMAGCFPLSASLDSIGPLANKVSCCAILDQILSNLPALGQVAPSDVSIIVPTNVIDWGLDAEVARAFVRTIATLHDHGLPINYAKVDLIDEADEINGESILSVYECYRHHEAWVNDPKSPCDPMVRARIMPGQSIPEARYREVLNRRRAITRDFQAHFGDRTFMATPTVSIVPPRIRDLADEKDYRRINRQVLRTTSLANCLDGASISLPCHRAGEAPVGFMLTGAMSSDLRLLALARSVERLVRQ